MPNKKSAYQFKTTIKNIQPPIWRRLLLPSDATFWELHIAIQDSFGWTDSHLHQFTVGSTWDRNSQYVCLPTPEDDFPYEKEPLDESKTPLSDLLSERKGAVTYEYDFGDSWEHQIVLEKILPFDPKEIYPEVIAGKRACPWEDSGGPFGYQEKIKILQNKNHEEHKDIADWLGVEDFNELDIESFDPDDVIFRNPVTELRRTQKGFEKEFSFNVH